MQFERFYIDFFTRVTINDINIYVFGAVDINDIQISNVSIAFDLGSAKVSFGVSNSMVLWDICKSSKDRNTGKPVLDSMCLKI